MKSMLSSSTCIPNCPGSNCSLVRDDRAGRRGAMRSVRRQPNGQPLPVKMERQAHARPLEMMLATWNGRYDRFCRNCGPEIIVMSRGVRRDDAHGTCRAIRRRRLHKRSGGTSKANRHCRLPVRPDASALLHRMWRVCCLWIWRQASGWSIRRMVLRQTSAAGRGV